MQEKINVREKEIPLHSWEGAAEITRRKLTKHKKEMEVHLKRISTLTKSLKYFEKQIKSGVPWCGEWGRGSNGEGN